MRSLDRTINRLEHAKRQMPRGYCSEEGCLSPNTRNGTCSKHDRTPLKLERDQPGLYFGEYRGHRVRVDRHPRLWRASGSWGTGMPIVAQGSTYRAAAAALVSVIDRFIDEGFPV